MRQVAEHLAELTGFRDRDILDVSLVGALRDLLRPTLVAIHRCVGEPGAQRWLTRARLGLHDVAASGDPLWSDLDSLPELAAHPDRMVCLQGVCTVASAATTGTPALTLFPLTTDLDVAGVLEVQTLSPLGDEAQRMVDSILRVYRNFQGLLDYSERDTLTGLLNRKTFDDSFMRIAASAAPAPATAGAEAGRRSAVQGGGPWLAMIDIDHFKRVNDTYGHLIGDEVLLLLSRLMRSSFRFHDHLYRFGGEEFVALIRCGQASDAVNAFERLRANVESYAFPRVGKITVSIGFTQVRPGDTPSGAFERADKAVYHAKQHGRNQVGDHALLVAAGELEDESRDSDVEFF